MGTFSIWHWIIVMILVGTPIGLALFGVSSVSPEARIGRQGYVLRTLSAIVGLIVLGGVLSTTAGTNNEGITRLAGLLIFYAVLFMWFRWSAARAQDIGRGGKWLTLWFLFPALGFLVWFPLAFRHSKPPEPAGPIPEK